MAVVHVDEIANKTGGVIHRPAAATLTFFGLALAVVVALLIIPFFALRENELRSGEYWD